MPKEWSRFGDVVLDLSQVKAYEIVQPSIDNYGKSYPGRVIVYLDGCKSVFEIQDDNIKRFIDLMDKQK